ncbi:MAG: diaminopimelate epimerase [Candidatus Aenigmarchaeota archaeon]|nr:diaminopimelate epimerase [Candidatus Aenigmarchaeota archaeon]
MDIQITKMHGIGNSYVIIEDIDRALEPKYTALAKLISDKNFGIGSDGILVVNKGRLAKYWMRVFNPDGSEAEKSGNGIRMFARYLYDKKLISNESDIEVGGRHGGQIVRPRITSDKSVTVNMGKGEILEKEIIVVEEMEFNGIRVSVGNPHFVIFAKNEKEADAYAKKYGSAIENHGAFSPARTNVEFVSVPDKRKIFVSVWERGAGLTLSSGTGSCAAAFAAFKENRIENKVTVKLAGGDLMIEIRNDDSVLMTGPAEYIFSGAVDLDKLLK